MVINNKEEKDKQGNRNKDSFSLEFGLWLRCFFCRLFSYFLSYPIGIIFFQIFFHSIFVLFSFRLMEQSTKTCHAIALCYSSLLIWFYFICFSYKYNSIHWYCTAVSRDNNSWIISDTMHWHCTICLYWCITIYAWPVGVCRMQYHQQNTQSLELKPEHWTLLDDKKRNLVEKLNK